MAIQVTENCVIKDTYFVRIKLGDIFPSIPIIQLKNYFSQHRYFIQGRHTVFLNGLSQLSYTVLPKDIFS